MPKQKTNPNIDPLAYLKALPKRVRRLKLKEFRALMKARKGAGFMKRQRKSKYRRKKR